jgi:hypothetical protein
MRSTRLVTAMLGSLATLLYVASAAAAMPIPDPHYQTPAGVRAPAAATTTSTPLWPYLVVAAAAVIVTLAAVALVSAARNRHIAKLRHA